VVRKSKNEPVIINFDRIWRFLPMNRPQKEFLKTVLFSLFPFFFGRWAVYQNWYHARCFLRDSSADCNGFRLAITIQDSLQPPCDETPMRQHPKIALVIHAFYPEILREMLEMFQPAYTTAPKVFVTCPQEHEQICNEILRKRGLPYQLLVVDNRGRDILPFLTILPFALAGDFEIILKLHTKKSMHLKRNREWRNDLYKKLLAGDTPVRMACLFQNFPQLGMIAPAGHILPMSLYYGANAARVKELCMRMGLHEEHLRDYIFVAGSMFAIRAQALEPVLALRLKEADFEPENRQVDGTLAHAVERIFTAALIDRGLTLCDTDSYTGCTGFRVSRNYKFTL
jgi:lipopolysaccharide biosynthesis protein